MPKTAHAFTRVELMAVLAALGFLGAIALPLFALTRADSDRASCFNNLRRIGGGVALWGNDDDDLPPWLVPPSRGGSFIFPKTAVVWTEFITLSNESVTPLVLACPADPTVKVSSHWGSSANGLANTGFRNNAVSYFLSYHSDPLLPRSVITGDRDFNPSSPTPVSCARGPNNALAINSTPGVAIAWTNALHRANGHLLTADGGVSFTPSSSLKVRLLGTESQDDNAGIHIIYPR